MHQLRDDEQQLIESINSYTQKLEELKSTYISQEEKNGRLSAEYAGMSQRLTTIKQQIAEVQDVEKQVREDLAVRTRALDARESTLKIREHKVAQGETLIQQNANLLEL